jgi:F-type H+-transporting ATPase subunit epsilon
MAAEQMAGDSQEPQDITESPVSEEPQETLEAAPVTLHVVLVTGDRPMYDGPASRVIAEARYGQIAMGAHHAPMVAALEPSELIIRHEETEHYFAIGGGFCEVHDNKVVILADTAERPEEIDLERAESAMARAALRMRSFRSRPGAAAAQEAMAAQRALARAKARIRVAGRRQRRRRR